MLKIAVVDDERDLADIYSKVVQNFGCPPPSIFHDGASLVRALMADHTNFDIVLLDYSMPEMNGIEAAKIIQRYRKYTKIIVTSGYDFAKEKADEIGVSFLPKPFSARQLAQILDDTRHAASPR
jgi:CheY-like chemotaxis protein